MITGRERSLLRRIDSQLYAQLGHPPSLSPFRHRSRRMVELGPVLLARKHEAQQRSVVIAALARIVDQQLKDFPASCFWDFDHLFAVLCHQESSRDVETLCNRLCGLYARFGQHSRLHFRYSHDFIYGFDWARWRRQQGGLGGPYSTAFLDYLDHRGRELEAILDQGGDEDYPVLAAGTARNPFSFERDPRSESRLHRLLSQRRQIPVEAWRCFPQAKWQLDFSKLRHDAAAELSQNGKSSKTRDTKAEHEVPL